MIKKITVACLLFVLANVGKAQDMVEIYVGEIKILKVDAIERIAVGLGDLLSTSILNNGQLLLIAETAGDTSLHIWFKNGKEQDMMVRITPEIGTIKAIRDEVAELLRDVAGLNVRIVGKRIVLSGKIDQTYEDAIGTVQSVYDQVMDLTQKLDPEIYDVLELPSNKMVIMNTKFTEFNKNYIESLGIDWDTQIAGPAAAFAMDGVTSRNIRPAGSSSFEERLQGRLDNPRETLGFQATSAFGYFGIASEIGSRINFAVDTGNAILLAEPRLATRSGGEATFLAGGEFPIEISNINGTTVEFKEFGIALEISPEVDQNNNIRASVMTEVSAIDNSVAVNGIPGLLTRRTDTEISMKSGETLVISGLLNQQASKDISGIKFLMDIPVLGELFKSENFRDQKTELVIFVTPTVFDADSDINREAQEYAEQGVADSIEAIDKESLDIIY